MNNLEIYNKVKTVPDNAKKEIKAGRIKGFTDINPMWRIQQLTETFGVCGVGWYTEITNQWLEHGYSEISAFCNINLYIKMNNEWSKPIFGTGGSKFVSQESSGAYMNDEAFKMAYTDALSVACKALGFGADVYWNQIQTKYDAQKPDVSGLKSVLVKYGKYANRTLGELSKEELSELRTDKSEWLRTRAIQLFDLIYQKEDELTPIDEVF